jgi:uncharacterized coiled-coil protein SlyX
METAMSAREIILALRDKRSELADAIAELERQVDRQRADLGHVDATIRLFDPSIEDEPSRSTTPRAHNNWFRPGECRRRIYDVLREATEPMTTRDVVAGVMKAKGLPGEDARTRELVHKTVLCSLNRARDTIERSEAAGVTAWRVI